MRVLDSDYDNYMLMYHCVEDYPDSVENETSDDVHSHLTHERSISVLLRDPINFPKEKLENLIASLKEKVPGIDFDETHHLLDHSTCPEGDLFALDGALNTADLKQQLDEMEDEPEVKERLEEPEIKDDL